MNEGAKKNNKQVHTWDWNLPRSGVIHLHNKAIVQYLKTETRKKETIFNLKVCGQSLLSKLLS